MNKKAERGRATRDQLVEIATALFAERGYEDTSIEAVLQESGVSRGALYHHFAGKEALFGAVLEAVEGDIAQKMTAAVGVALGTPADPVGVLRAGCLAWVRLAGDPVVQQILLIDAPAVIGWQQWRELDERFALGDTKALLGLVAESGGLAAELVDPFAHMLLAALNEIALLIARADDVDAAMRDGTRAVEELLDRLLGPGGPGRQSGHQSGHQSSNQ